MTHGLALGGSEAGDVTDDRLGDMANTWNSSEAVYSLLASLPFRQL